MWEKPSDGHKFHPLHTRQKQGAHRTRGGADTVMDQLHQIVVSCDATGIIRYVNAAWEQVLGYRCDASVGRPLGAFILEEDRRRWARLLTRAPIPMDAEFRLCHDSGSIRWFRISLRFGEGRWTGFMDDVTRRCQLDAIHARLHSLEALRREATERLLASEDAARIMGEVVASVAESIDAAGATLCVLSGEQPMSRRVYQRGMQAIPDELHELPVDEIEYWKSILTRRQGAELIPSDDMPEGMCARLERLAIQALVGVPVFVEEEIWGFVVLDENFEVRQWQPEETGSLLAIAESMSMAMERDRARTKILQAKERAEMAVERLKELDQLKSEFLSTVSHELRTPLASITGFTTTMLEDPELEADVQEEFLGIIHRESTRLAHIIEDLLDFARIEQGAMKIELVFTDLVALIREVTELMGHRFSEKDIALEFDLHQDSLCLHLDPTRIGQVVKNLMSNALKFTPSRGKVRIRLFPTETTAVLEVQDTGVGIPLEAQSSVFERFYRVPEHTMMASGTGLGLPICKKIVELHYGRIDLTSAKGEGTTIRVELPLSPQDKAVPVGMYRMREQDGS